MAAEPIWKDKIIDLGSDQDAYDFRIRLQDNGRVIYTGRVNLRPGEGTCWARINDICADWLQNSLPTLSQAEFTALSFPVTFNVEYYDEEAAEWVGQQVQFINDWSYDRFYDVSRDGMAFPINGHLDARQWVMWTGYDVASVTADLYFKDGSHSQVIIPVAISADLNLDYNSDFARQARSAGSGTAVFDLSAWENLDHITINGRTYPVVSDCRRYALFYVNAYGGWDSLLIEGNTKMSDALTRHSFGAEYDNRDVTNRGTRNYVNEIDRSYTMVTGWLSDEEASRMHHLLGSTDVYLYDILTKEMTPVVCTDNTCEYKTYKGNGNKLVNYTLQVKVAQSLIRR